MTTNEGVIDRSVRIIVGFVLIAVALGLFGPAYTSVWGWIGILPLVTGVVGWCPAYSVLGIKTCATWSGLCPSSARVHRLSNRVVP